MTIQTSIAGFDASPVIPPVLSNRRFEQWRTHWQRIGCPVLNPDREHFVIVREVGDREVGVIA